MNLTEKILKFTAVGLSLKGKTLRLLDEEFIVGIAAVTNDNGPRADLPALTLQLFFEDDGPKGKSDCDCHTCKASAALTGKVAIITTSLLTSGKAGKLLLDSCGASEDGFTAKVRNTTTRRCDVGEGPSMIIAVAHAVAKAANL